MNQCAYTVLFEHWLNATTWRYDRAYCTRDDGHPGHHVFQPYPTQAARCVSGECPPYCTGPTPESHVSEEAGR